MSAVMQLILSLEGQSPALYTDILHTGTVLQREEATEREREGEVSGGKREKLRWESSKWKTT